MARILAGSLENAARFGSAMARLCQTADASDEEDQRRQVVIVGEQLFPAMPVDERNDVALVRAMLAIDLLDHASDLEHCRTRPPPP